MTNLARSMRTLTSIICKKGVLIFGTIKYAYILFSYLFNKPLLRYITNSSNLATGNIQRSFEYSYLFESEPKVCSPVNYITKGIVNNTKIDLSLLPTSVRKK